LLHAEGPIAATGDAKSTGKKEKKESEGDFLVRAGGEKGPYQERREGALGKGAARKERARKGAPREGRALSVPLTSPSEGGNVDGGETGKKARRTICSSRKGKKKKGRNRFFFPSPRGGGERETEVGQEREGNGGFLLEEGKRNYYLSLVEGEKVK